MLPWAHTYLSCRFPWGMPSTYRSLLVHHTNSGDCSCAIRPDKSFSARPVIRIFSQRYPHPHSVLARYITTVHANDKDVNSRLFGCRGNCCSRSTWGGFHRRGEKVVRWGERLAENTRLTHNLTERGIADGFGHGGDRVLDVFVSMIVLVVPLRRVVSSGNAGRVGRGWSRNQNIECER